MGCTQIALHLSAFLTLLEFEMDDLLNRLGLSKDLGIFENGTPISLCNVLFNTLISVASYVPLVKS
jgi:hypothetical protein